jgi:hypothetical protein
MIRTYLIREGQTLFDLALQLYGDPTKAIELCKLNPDTIPNLLVNNLRGLTINYEEQSNDVVKHYSTNSININTRYPLTTSTTTGGFSVGFGPGFYSPTSSS